MTEPTTSETDSTESRERSSESSSPSPRPSSPYSERDVPLHAFDPEYRHPTGRFPRRVCLLALGQSLFQFFNDRHTKNAAIGQPKSGTYYAETWVVNRAIKTLAHDVAFVLDDLRAEATKDPEYGLYLRAATRPIVTSTPYDEFPAAHPFPLLPVSRAVGPSACYWHNSIPLILGYAWAIGVSEITLYGVDYTHPQQLAGEAERGSAEFMCGWLRAKGMTVRVAASSSLLNNHRGGFHNYLYGWLTPPPEYLDWLRSQGG